MRRIYDGHLRKEYGTDDARQEHEWKGRITFAVATTDDVDRHYSVFQTLGERFVMIRWNRPGGIEAALMAMNQDCAARATDLKNAVHELMIKLAEKHNPEISSDMQLRIAALAEFAVRARTHIPRSGYSKEIEYVPEPEAATRLAQQLAQLAKGFALVWERGAVEEEDFSLVKRVAFDCIPTTRRKVLESIRRGENPDKLGLPNSTLYCAKDDLQALDLLSGETLSEFSSNLLAQAGCLV